MREKRMKNEQVHRMYWFLCVMSIIILVYPAAAGAAAPEESVIGADGNPLSYTSTYAGSGMYEDIEDEAELAAFRAPEGVLVLDEGTILVADTMNHRIRQITKEQVTTFAGIALFPTDGTEGLKGALLDGDRTAAVFHSPKGLAIDKKGNIYVADSKNHAVRKISTNGEVTTIAGDGVLGKLDGQGDAARFYEPSDVAVAEDGTVYVADTLNHAIRRIHTDGTVTTLNALSDRILEIGPGILTEAGGYKDGALVKARFNEPSGIAIDAKGNLFVADTGNHLIRYIDLEKKTVATVAGNAEVQYDAENLYAAGGYKDGAAAEALFHFPKGIAVTETGGLVIADSMNHRVRYLYDGQVITLAGSVKGNIDGINGKNRLEFPTAVAIQKDGRILVTDTYNNKIRLVEFYRLPAAVTRNQIDIVYDSTLLALDTLPEIKNGRTMIPLRAVSEHLGYIVDYNAANQSIRIVQQGKTLLLTIGEKDAAWQDEAGEHLVLLDAAPYIKGSRVYVPLRFFSEAFGYHVDWDAQSRTVIIR